MLEWRKNPRTGKEEPTSKLTVRKIGYDEKRRINLLVISNGKDIVYKFFNTAEEPEKPKKAEKKAIVEIPLAPEITCPVCGKAVLPVTTKNGRTKSAEDVFNALGLCYECYQAQGAQK